jgi:hypothetical protein
MSAASQANSRSRPTACRGKENVMHTKLARSLFGASLALYVLWVGALVALAVVSGNRPGERQPQLTPAAAAAPDKPEQPRK